ncbi:TolC family protein [Pedobacter sp. BS3]|uniref:TolC family protein n=1 Tax=Pedobacter sp. BS3 TaxID=2567937 RepID=UPI0011EF7E4B|nr:TolC family protein [Pedobacter sp. BS3]TZF84711.1 TolC family protein [Pedobacter sp. BS3]
MHYKPLKYYLIILLFLPGLTVFARQEQDTVKTALPAVWTLQQCLDYAKQHNISINSLRLNKEASRQDLIASKAAVLPDLYGSVSQNLSHNNRNEVGTSSANVNGSAGISTSWTLYNGGYLRNDIRQKDLSVQSSNLSVLEAGNSISVQIVQAYLNILLDKETILYAEDLVATSKTQVSQMQQQYNVGAVAKKDLVQLSAQLANDQYTLTTAQNAERQDKLNLKQLLQLPTGQSFDIVKPDSAIALAAIPSLNEVLTLALNTRPEMQNSKLGVDIAQLDLAKARAGYKPTISLGGGIGTSYGNNSSYNAFNQLNDNFYQQIGITASIPIFTRKQNKTNEAKARINVSQAELDYQNTKTVLSQEVEQAFINAQNAGNQYTASLEQLKYTQEAYRIAGEELRVGASNTVEYVQQKNLYIQALQAYTQAKYNALLSLKIYEFYKGEPLTLK